MDYPEDEHLSLGGLTPGLNSEHDAVDDAHYVRLLHLAVSQRVGLILGSIQHDTNRDSILCYGLGWPDSSTKTGHSDGSGTRAC